MEKATMKSVLEVGAEVTGATVGAIVGLVGGPVGAVAGSTAGIVVSKGLLEVIDRNLSKREEVRLGASAYYALDKMTSKIDEGQVLRSDDFFNDNISRNKADELLEGVLLKSKDQYEEKKIKYISNIYVNTAFDESISAENANDVLIQCGSLSYRRLCILSIQKNNSINNIPDGDLSYIIRNKESGRGYDTFSTELIFLLQDYLDLFSLGLLKNEHNTVVLDLTDLNLSETSLSSIGELYHNLMELHDIETDDLRKILDLFDELKRHLSQA